MEIPPIPSQELAAAETALQRVREALQELLRAMPPGFNSALRFEPGDPEL